MATQRTHLLIASLLLLATLPAHAEFIDFNGDVDPDIWTLLGTAEVLNMIV